MLIIATLRDVVYALLTILIVLVGGIAFTKTTRRTHPWLNWLNGKQFWLLWSFVGCLALWLGLEICGHILDNRRRFQMVDLSEFTGEMATKSQFEHELPDSVRAAARQSATYFQAAEEDFAARHYADAATAYHKSLSAVPTMSAYLNGGIALTLSGKRPAALADFKEGLELARRQKDIAFQSNFLSNLAFEYADSGDLEVAESYARGALQLSKQGHLLSHEARASVLLATILEEEGHIRDATAYADQGLAAYRGLKDEVGEATALATLGLLYADSDSQEQAVRTLKEALTLHQKVGDVNGQIKVLYNLGIVLSDHGDLGGALEDEQMALELATPEIAAFDRANILNNMGTLYWRKHKYDVAETSVLEAREAYLRLGSKRGLASTLINLGDIYADVGNLGGSANAFLEAADTFHSLGDKANESTAVGNVAEVHRRQGKYEQAIREATQALQIGEGIQFHAGIANASGTMGLAYAELHKKSDAISALRTACSLAQEYKLNLDQLSDYQSTLKTLESGHTKNLTTKHQ